MKLAHKLFLTNLIFLGLVFVFATNTLAATLMLSPETGNFAIGDEFDVNIMLDTVGEEVNGVDVTINYDSTMLDVVTLTEGTLFGNYPIKSASAGVVTFTGIITTGSPTGYTGQGVFGTVKFKVKQTGTAQVTFDFTQGAIADSNVVSKTSGQDLLTAVTNGSYILSPSSNVGTTDTNTTTTTATTTNTAITGDDIETGVYDTGLLIFGMFLVSGSLIYIFKQQPT